MDTLIIEQVYHLAKQLSPADKRELFERLLEVVAAETQTPVPPNTFRSEEELKQMLQAGLDSGPAAPMISSDWESIRQEVRARRAAAKNAVCKGTRDDSKSAPENLPFHVG